MQARSMIAAMASCAAAFLVAPGYASADTLTPGAPDTSGIHAIGKGIKEIGGESLLVLGYAKEGSASSFRVSTVTGLSFRYFVVNNLALSLNASYFVKDDDDAGGRQGGVFTLGASYFINIGKGLFLNPGLAGGGFIGKDFVKGGSTAPNPTVFGGAARAGFGLAFYASPHFSLFARPEAILYVSKQTLGTTSDTVLTLDAGFNVGMSYVL